MNIKHLFFCMLLIAFSSCSKPGYEKAIAEWVQTDSHGTWTDLSSNYWKCWKQKTSPYRTACAT